MTTEATLVKEAGLVDFKAAGALASGEVIEHDGKAVVVAGLAAIVLNDPVAAHETGQFRFLSASATTFTAGDPVYWDASASLAIASPGAADDLFLGICAFAKVSGDLNVLTNMNDYGIGMGRGAWTSLAVEVDHADSDNVNIIEASQNPSGLLVLSFLGEVTETIAGSTEDQLIIGLYDSDDTAQDTLTTSATPDAVGDIVVGVRSAYQASTGVVIAKIAAGLSAYVKVDQATAGTPAGKVKVRCIVCPLI